MTYIVPMLNGATCEYQTPDAALGTALKELQTAIHRLEAVNALYENAKASGKAALDMAKDRDAAIAERDHWKANHDNQVAIKAAILDRPDLKDRAKLVLNLIAERDRLLRENEDLKKDAYTVAHAIVGDRLKDAIAERDRLENELSDEICAHKVTSNALEVAIARAEKAERERDRMRGELEHAKNALDLACKTRNAAVDATQIVCKERDLLLEKAKEYEGRAISERCRADKAEREHQTTTLALTSAMAMFNTEKKDRKIFESRCDTLAARVTELEDGALDAAVFSRRQANRESGLPEETSWLDHSKHLRDQIAAATSLLRESRSRLDDDLGLFEELHQTGWMDESEVQASWFSDPIDDVTTLIEKIDAALNTPDVKP